ncbi:MAG: SH3 domain-containing protein [Clostridia bacterium]|nr:SH3 domain-containing protein [Clostridia bacterium]
MKTKIAVLALTTLLVLTFLLPASAEFYARVSLVDSLNIRSGPGSNYAWLGSIPRDGMVYVTGEYGDWYQVVTLDGSVSGFMYKPYLVPVGQDTVSPSVGYGVVANTDSLNLRSGPGTGYNWLGSAARGEWVEITGESEGWYRVNVLTGSLQGASGYMSSNFIQVSQTQATGFGISAVVQNPAGTRFLNLRAEPSYNAQVLDIFYTGETCRVLEKRNDGWWYVSAQKNGQNLTGYFRCEYLSLVGGSAGSEGAAVNTWQNGGNGGSLNLRAEPSLYSQVLCQIPNGTVVSVFLKGSKWWQVAYNGNTGFVDSAFVSGGGSAEPVAPGTAVVQTGNGGKLNLREQPNTNSRVLGQYDNGIRVNVLERGLAWCYVQAGGQTGYMMTKYLRISGGTETRTVINNNGGSYVNLRTSPEKASGNVNVRVPVGSRITLLSWGQEWSQVSYNGRTGYMMTGFLQ